eukprot:g45927.t1
MTGDFEAAESSNFERILLQPLKAGSGFDTSARPDRLLCRDNICPGVPVALAVEFALQSNYKVTLESQRPLRCVPKIKKISRKAVRATRSTYQIFRANLETRRDSFNFNISSNKSGQERILLVP